MLNSILLIPAFEPTSALLKLCGELRGQIIIIVNDGTKSPLGIEIFAKLETNPDITVIHHSKNKGKGAALKTGFLHILENYSFNFVITLDADGQHLPTDVERISAEAAMGDEYDLILGVRNFDGKIPFKSRLGNTLTSIIFKWIYRTDLKDTQTGLRAYGKSSLPELLEILSNKYDFELDVLIYMVKKRKNINCVDISTIYVDDNKGSHFRPIIDSFLIYRTLIGFSLSSILSFLIDYVLFVVMFFSTQSILLSTVIPRFISGYVNFNLNSKLFLNYNINGNNYALKYIILAASVYILSYVCLYSLNNLSVNIYLAKILVDILLFLLSFFVQRRLFMS